MPSSSGGTAGFTPNPEKRAQILESARRVFFSDGYGAATIDKIAVDSTVSKATIYKYFDSKQAIFVALMGGPVGAGVNGFTIDPDDAPPDVLRRAGKRILNRMLDPESMQMFRLMVAESARFPELGAAFEAQGPRRGQVIIARYLGELVERGALAIDDPRLAAAQFIGLCQAGIFMRAQLTDFSPTDEQIDTIVESAVGVFLRGYAPN